VVARWPSDTWRMPPRAVAAALAAVSGGGKFASRSYHQLRHREFVVWWALLPSAVAAYHHQLWRHVSACTDSHATFFIDSFVLLIEGTSRLFFPPNSPIQSIEIAIETDVDII
jgi:hypothetical protein